MKKVRGLQCDNNNEIRREQETPGESQHQTDLALFTYI